MKVSFRSWLATILLGALCVGVTAEASELTPKAKKKSHNKTNDVVLAQAPGQVRLVALRQTEAVPESVPVTVPVVQAESAPPAFEAAPAQDSMTPP
ncbi:MAG TPA: hypothetical protein DEB39_04095, partial [Planctomycetaceae bacterium]|nr:hypothetical protein [Planctomycetaceae bacterium]